MAAQELYGVYEPYDDKVYQGSSEKEESEEITNRASFIPKRETSSQVTTPKPKVKEKKEKNSFKTTIADGFKKLRLKPSRWHKKNKKSALGTESEDIIDHSIPISYNSPNMPRRMPSDTTLYMSCPTPRPMSRPMQRSRSLISQLESISPIGILTIHSLTPQTCEGPAENPLIQQPYKFTRDNVDHALDTHPNYHSYISVNSDDTSYGLTSDIHSIPISIQHISEAPATTHINNQSHHCLEPRTPPAGEEYLSDSSDDTDDWIETVERKTDTSVSRKDFRDPPAKLLELIYSTCKTRGVRRIVWSQDVGKPNHYIVKAAGIPEDIRYTLEKEVNDRFPGCSVKLVDTKVITHNLSAHIIETNCNPYNDKTTWTDNGRASCELIVTGQQVDRGETGYYCVTSAHLLMTEAESWVFETDEGEGDTETEKLKLEELRNKVLLRKKSHTHRLKLGRPNGNPPDKIWLPGMPMLGYRVFINEEQRRFQNDIALFAIEDFDTLNANFRNTCNSFCLSNYNRRLLSQQDIVKLTGATIYIRDLEGILVPPQRSYPDDALGQHISFTVNDGGVLGPGDSGSVVYVKVNDQLKPLAILKGIRAKKRTGEPESEEETKAEKNIVYDAILLNAALQDIEQDYSHLVRNLRVFTRPVKHI